MACSVGGLLFIDFADPQNPIVEKLETTLPGYRICVIDTGANHAQLTDQYVAIFEELRQIASFFGKEVLCDVNQKDFFDNYAALRKACGDRAVLRAVHVYHENARVLAQREALQKGAYDYFYDLVNASGRSSFMYLQNVTAAGQIREQSLAVTLALCSELLKGRGAFRIQGGGFAGTVEAFVPEDMITEFSVAVEKALGKGCCHILSIRKEGAMRI
jgi:galactokinase